MQNNIFSCRTTKPDFPCWLWSDICDKWIFYKTSQGYTGPEGWHLFWTKSKLEPENLFEQDIKEEKIKLFFNRK